MGNISLLALLVALLYGLSFYCIFRILLSYRTTQGAVAWIIALLTFPYLALFLYALFGRNRFSGYVRARRTGDQEVAHLVDALQSAIGQYQSGAPQTSPELRVLTSLVRLPFTTGNHCRLLHNGSETFDALFEALDKARSYVLLEFYIVRNDHIGRRVQDALLRKLHEGVAVYFIYDDIGSAGLPTDYIESLSQAGAQIRAFDSGNRRRRRFQINFRNHRKLLICDGEVGFVGGINLGDEYLGAEPTLSPWRDTHCQVEGPAVRVLQLSFLEDWYWVANRVPPLNWSGHEPEGGGDSVLVLPSSPADDFETCTLFFLNCINSARERIWIASPYFVPDLQIVNALQLASLRGVDVRIIIPENPDHKLIRLAAYSYLVQASRAGINIYRYQPGFMHQKVLLVDDRYAAVGTANLDNRSMRLNFEMTLLVTSPNFVEAVTRMLEHDLTECIQLTAKDYQDRSLLFRLACRGVRLAAPLL